MAKMTLSQLGETKKKELDKLIMLGELQEKEIANKLSIDCGIVITRKRMLKSRKNFEQNCLKLRKKINEAELAATGKLEEEQNPQEAPDIEEFVIVPQNPNLPIVIKEEKPKPKKKISKKRSSKSNVISDDQKILMAQEYEKCHSATKVARIFNCSTATVVRAAQSLGVYTPNEALAERAAMARAAKVAKREAAAAAAVQQQEQELPQVVTDDDESVKFIETKVDPIIEEKSANEGFYELDLGDHVVCSVFTDRHDVPKDCKLAIFESNCLENFRILDFNYIDSKVQKFILEHIEFNEGSNPNKDLIVYVTGLQSVLGSICKQCAAMNIRLTLMHYDPTISKWFAQVVLPGLGEAATYSGKLDKLYEFDHVMVKNGIDRNSLSNVEFYAAVKTYYKDVDQRKEESFCYICTDEVEAFDTFRDLSIEIRKEVSKYASVYLYQVQQKKTELKFSSSIAKSYNFRK